MTDKKDTLRGLRVLDLSSYFSGSYCSMLLAESGAEVIKVEDTRFGDPLRSLPPLRLFLGSVFHQLGKGKTSIQVNLFTPEGVEIVQRLVDKTDVLIVSPFPGGELPKDLGPEALRGRNSRLIYCAISPEGMEREASGFGLNMLAASGYLAHNAQKDGTPIIPPSPLADIAGGVSACNRILLALFQRAQHDKGSYIDHSLKRSMVRLMSTSIAEESAKGKEGHDSFQPGYLQGKLPCYNVYQTKDGKYAALAALEEGQWVQFCEAFGAQDMLDSQFDDTKAALERMRHLFSKRSFSEIERIAAKTACCLTPVRTVGTLLATPEFREEFLEFVQHETDGKVPVTSRGLQGERAAPTLGASTIEVLRDAGYRQDEIAAFKSKGVINYPPPDKTEVLKLSQ